MERQLEIGPLWDRLWARRRGILTFVTVAAILSVAAALLMPRWYRSTASLLPPSEEESALGIGGFIKGLSVPGIKLPSQTSAADVFVAVLESRRIAEALVKRFDLKTRYKSKTLEATLKEFATHRKFKLTDSGTIEFWVEDKSPRRAQEMASALIEELDRFNREVRSNKGRRSREFLAQRLGEARTELAQAENVLARYQSQHKTVALSPEVSSAVETAARLVAQRTALQVRLGVIRSYSRVTTDEERQVLEQIAQLDRQLSALPATGVELARLLRDMKAQEQLYILLTAQYEEARLTEARDVVTVDVLDPPSMPEKPARPRRLFLVAGAVGLGLMLGVAWALWSERPARPSGAGAA